ncbi:hypothetical protein Hanom_Chr09g00790811 [Helianthus anomalus]
MKRATNIAQDSILIIGNVSTNVLHLGYLQNSSKEDDIEIVLDFACNFW